MTTTALATRQVEPRQSPPRPGLSVCCLTGGSRPDVLAAILELLRPVADEIVVALDERRRDAARFLGAADRVVLFRHAGPSDRPIAWLLAECGREWIFNIDDDEVPSAALVAELPSLIRRSDVTHCWIARRWLFPDVRSYLDEPPWSTEFQLRLFQADERFLRCTDEFHRPIACSGPALFVEAPLWHLDTALLPRERRQEKALSYERARRGMRIGAYSHNTGLYLPELRREPRLAPVPPEELERIVSVCRGRREHEVAPAVEEADDEALAREWPGAPFRASLYEARLTPLSAVAELAAGRQQTVDVRIANDGDCVWRFDAITIGTRWDGGAEGIRTALPADVRPGASAVVPVHVVPPESPGRHRLEIDLVHEHVRWFGRPLLLDVDVRGRRRVLVTGARDAVDLVLDALALVPDVEPVLVAEPGDEADRLGPERAAGLGGYLFGPGGVDAWRALTRAVALPVRVRLGGSGGPAGDLVEALRGCECLLVVGADLRPAAPQTRERLRSLVTIVTARAAGVPVLEVGDGEPAAGVADRVLARLARSLGRPVSRRDLPAGLAAVERS